MTWILTSVMANVSFVGLEYCYRAKLFPNYWQSLPVMLPLMLLANYLLFHVYRSAPSFLLGWAVLSLGNAICRVGTNYILGEPINWTIAWGLFTMLSGMMIIKHGS